MRKTLLGALGTAALLISSSTSASAATTSRVDGSHFTNSGIRLVRQDCADPGQSSPGGTPILIKQDVKKAPLGTRFIGWRPTQTGYEYGTAARVASPTAFNGLSVHLFWPRQQASGQVVAYFSASGDTGEWRGKSTLPIDRTFGWHTVQASQPTFDWYHYSDGVLDQSAPSATLSDFATAHGGDGNGAHVGLAYGCDGNAFYTDALAINTDSGKHVYDFEGFRTRTQLNRGTKTLSSITIDYGRGVGLTALLRQAVDDKAIAGRVRLDSRPLSSRKWTNHTSFKVGKTGHDFRVGPAHSAAYHARYVGTVKNEASSSKVLKILVRSKVRAGLVDATVTKGKTFTTTGRVLPGRAAKVVLQRYAHQKWTSIKSGKAGRDGRFHISMTTKTVGTSYWRIRVGSGAGNIGNNSSAMKLTTKSPPSTGGSGDGGGGGTYDPPTPPPTH